MRFCTVFWSNIRKILKNDYFIIFFVICTVAHGFSMVVYYKNHQEVHKNGCRSSNLTMKLVQPQTVSIECMYWAFFARETKIQHRYARILVINASPHTLLLKKNKQKQWTARQFEHGCALYRCLSVCQYVWDAYGDHFRHVGRGSSVDMYRILIIHVLARAMWIRSTGSRIVCLWVAVAWICSV